MIKDLKTEEKILRAAKEVFSNKGLDGARMQEISEKANINKSLLHYYFRTKDKLFETIVDQIANAFFPVIVTDLTTEEPIEKKIELFAVRYICFIQEHPFLPNFVLNMINQNPGKLLSLLKIKDISKKLGLQELIDNEAAKGNIKKVDANQLLINVLSLCIFPFIAKPMLFKVLNYNEKKFEEMIEERKTIVPDVINSWLKSK